VAIKDFIEIEKEPRRGLILLEWGVIIYILFTGVMMYFLRDGLSNLDAMVEGRVRIAASIVAMWVVYRLMPCRLTMGLRVFIQLAMLGWWYPDTYELNRCLPNLDHLFAQADENLFGFQPALLFHEQAPWPVLSEALDFGYVAYYPMMVIVLLSAFCYRYQEFTRCAFIVIGSFFVYYVIFDLLPVAGPTYYYPAIGFDNVTAGLFPSVGDYFNVHDECLPVPGHLSGVGYWMVEIAKIAGERPTAAFPSSHVGVATVCMLLVWFRQSRKLFFILLPFYVCLCLATVYIQAHYAVDAIAGLLTGVLIYYLLSFAYSCLRREWSRSQTEPAS